MLKLRTDTVYVGAGGKLTQAGVEAIQGQLDDKGSLSGLAAVEAAVAGSFIRPQTPVTASSQTEIDFTGIPSWVNRVTVMFSGLSTSGTSVMTVRLGDSGGIEATGYSGASSATGNGVASAATNFTTGFAIFFGGSDTAAATRSGAMVISRIAGNTWVCSSNIGLGNTTATSTTGGDKTLSDVLTQLRVTTVGGTDTFDAGSVNISWE